MSQFKWNERREPYRHWDWKKNVELTSPGPTDKEIIATQKIGSYYEETLRSLCRVVSELVELEENRAKKE